MGWALVFNLVMGVTLVLWDHVWRNRIIALEHAVWLLSLKVEAHASQEAWEIRRRIHKSIKQMHEMVLLARSRGNLDQANKLMEPQRWADVGYETEWLDGMFRGFP